MKYTFLLPAYKTKFIKESLYSIKNQTYKEFKVLVSDDCSPEPLREIFDEVCGDDNRFVFRRNKENIGGRSLVEHWNLLVDMCDTEFLIMASDDDIYDTHFLEEIDKLQVKYPEVDFIRSRVLSVDETGNMIIDDALYKEYVGYLGFLYQKHFNNALRCIANCVFRTRKLQQNGGFIDFPLAWYSDDATVLMMSKNGVANTRECLFSFRSSTCNISSRGLNHKDAFLKAKANILFDRWFKKEVELINEVELTQTERYQLLFAVGHHNRFIHEQFSYMSSNCNGKDFYMLLNYFPITMKIKLLYRYLRSKIKKRK